MKHHILNILVAGITAAGLPLCSQDQAGQPIEGDNRRVDAEPTDQPDKSRPAHEVYRNIQLFTRDDVSAGFFDELMDRISRDLGVPCAHCHDAAALHRDDLGPRKSMARETIPLMWRMVAEINADYFPGEGGPVRCWTCHQGAPAPTRRAPPKPSGGPGGKFPTEVGANLQVLEGLTRLELKAEMSAIAAALGLQCSDCHVVGDWASDEKPRKSVARKMLAMTRAIDQTYFEPGRGPTCWTCHRGSIEVVTSPE